MRIETASEKEATAKLPESTLRSSTYGFFSTNLPGGDLECTPRNPFRPLDWRWRRASLSATPTTRHGRRHDDTWVRHARRHLAACPYVISGVRRPNRAVREAINGAESLRAPSAIEIRDQIEARLLAGQDDVTIAERCQLDERIVTAYTMLFFDVRPLLRHSDKLASMTIGPRLFDADGGGAWVALRQAAIHGGAAVVDALLGGPRGCPPDPVVVRNFELWLQVRELDTESVGPVRLSRLAAYAERLAARVHDDLARWAPIPIVIPDLNAIRAALAVVPTRLVKPADLAAIAVG